MLLHYEASSQREFAYPSSLQRLPLVLSYMRKKEPERVSYNIVTEKEELVLRYLAASSRYICISMSLMLLLLESKCSYYGHPRIKLQKFRTYLRWKWMWLYWIYSSGIFFCCFGSVNDRHRLWKHSELICKKHTTESF